MNRQVRTTIILNGHLFQVSVSGHHFLNHKRINRALWEERLSQERAA